MKIIGVCGQTGSGKSTFSAFIAEKGGQNLEVDSIGHETLDIPEVKTKLVDFFGSDILDDSGDICRKSLGKKAFSTTESIKALNEIMHPIMVKKVEHIIEQDKKAGKKFIILNAALLFSMNLDHFCDVIIYVKSSPEVRLKRLVDLRGMDEARAKQRLFAQDNLPETSKEVVIVINNGSLTEFKKEAERVYNTIIK